MSISELFSPNDFVLYAGTMNANSGTSGSQTIDGTLTVNGGEFLNGALAMRDLDDIGFGTFPNRWSIYKNTGANNNLILGQGGNALNQDFAINLGTGSLNVSSININGLSGANYKLNYYEFRNIPVFFAGPWGAPLPSLLHFQVVGNAVTIMVDGVQAPNTAASTITGVPIIPVGLLPIQTVTQIIGAVDGGAN